MINLKLGQLVGGLIAIALIVAISTFFITKFATNDAINVSREQVSILSSKISELHQPKDGASYKFSELFRQNLAPNKRENLKIIVLNNN